MISKKGFTLVELAISLIIIGLISGMGVTAIITTLGEKRRSMDVEKDLTKLNEAFSKAIFDNTSKKIPSADTLQNLIPLSKQGSFVFKYNDNISVNICGIESTGCKVQVCDDEACTTSKDINNVLYSIIELGPNKTLDSMAPGAGNKCDVKINRFSKDNDDKITFSLLREVKASVGCDKEGTVFRILTPEFPVMYRDSFSKDGIIVSVTPVQGVKYYTWKFCLATPPSGIGNLILTSDNLTGPLFKLDECDDINTPDASLTTSGPTIVLTKTNNASLDLHTGNYKLNILVRYKDPVENKYIATMKEYELSIAERP